MAARTGSADLPLHGGRVPRWLASRMERLARVIAEAIVLEYGRDELLRRLAHPFWFQSFGSVMGMDWHSSGITTSVLGALKRGLSPVSRELGVYVCGGRGRHSRKTPEELARVGDATGVDGLALARASRLVAKVDSAAVQDGFQLYLHGFVVTESGRWTVVQQGMRPDAHTARCYHWLSEGLTSFVDDPHAAIDGQSCGMIVNLADRRAEHARAAGIELVRSGPQLVLRELAKMPQSEPKQAMLPHLILPHRHEVTYPVPLAVYDQTLRVLKSAVDRAKLGQDDKLAALRRLDAASRRLEQDAAHGYDFQTHLADERARSSAWGGRTVSS